MAPNRRAGRVAAAGVAVLIAGAGCGGEGARGVSADVLTVYSGREEEYVARLYDMFERDTGIELEPRYGDSAELAATLMEEGDASPADVFFSQDAGSLGAVAEAGMLAPLDEEVLQRVEPRFRSPDGLWTGTSGRARVAAYNTEQVDENDLPDSITGFTDPKWKGRIGFPPTNSSFQAFVAAMILTEGESATRAFLEGLIDNDPKFFEDNEATTRAVADGEIDVGFVNHYYLYEVEAEEGSIPVANHFFSHGDPGALVNAAGVGILRSAANEGAAERFVDFLLSSKAQSYFAREIWEYPLAAGVDPSAGLLPLQEIESPDIDLSDLGGSLERALHLLAETGIL
jgi:iron(III) transport system substrate-binding protein